MAAKLPKVVTRNRKRKGRGYGGGRGGHTVGRGMKGQKARSSVGILFEGVKVKKSLLKRLPLRRGKGKFKAKEKPIIVKLSHLKLFPAGAKVNIDSLVNKGIVVKEDAKRLGVKILGDGEIKKNLTIEVPISGNAAKKVEGAKGRIVKKNVKVPRPRQAKRRGQNSNAKSKASN